MGGGTIPALTGLTFARYATYDGNWASSIVLPATAANNTVVQISSNATYTSQISPQNILFANSIQFDSSGPTHCRASSRVCRFSGTASRKLLRYSGSPIFAAMTNRRSLALIMAAWAAS